VLSDLLFDGRSIGCTFVRVNGTIAEKYRRYPVRFSLTFIRSRHINGQPLFRYCSFGDLSFMGAVPGRKEV